MTAFPIAPPGPEATWSCGGRPRSNLLLRADALTLPAAAVVEGLTNPRSLGLERFPIRARQMSATLSAWRLTIASEQGEGTITLVEPSSEGVVYRGDGVFLGWTQDRLASAYAALVPKDEAAPFETQQLG